MILTGERGLQGSWLSTVNCNPREGHHKSFQFVTYILRRNFRSEWDVSRCCYDCPKCHHPESWAWWQDAFSQSEVRVITRWPMRSLSHLLGLVTCDVWHMGGVSRDRGAWHRVTCSQVQHINCCCNLIGWQLINTISYWLIRRGGAEGAKSGARRGVSRGLTF